MRPFRLALVAFTLTTGLVASAGTQVGPPSGVATLDADASGTASITGVVVADPSGQPVSGSQVTISAGALRRVTSTDPRGRFSFSSLPAAAFHLRASRPGYLGGVYVAVAPHDPGTLLRLRDREAREIVIRLPRGGVITGTVVDDRNLPVVGVRIVAARRDGTSEPHLTGSTVTDDLGAFRIHSLVPGRYVVCTIAPAFGAQGTRESLRAQLDALDSPPQAGRPPFAPTPEVAASRRAWLTEQLRLLKPDHGFAPTCLPAGGRGDDTIAVASGQEWLVDLQVHRVPLASVEVIVAGHDGNAGDLRASLHSDDAPLPDMNAQFAPLSGPGRFRFRGVTPGRYRLAVHAGRQAAVHHSEGGAPVRRLPSRYALADVEVNGEDIDGLVLELRDGIRISGRIAFDGTRQPPDDMGSVNVRVQPNRSGRGSRSPVMEALDTTADADGRFSIAGVPPGDYTFIGNAQGAPGWHLESAELDGRDLLDDALGVTGARDVEGVVLTFTDRITEVTGIALLAGGEPATGHVLLLYPDDEAARVEGNRRPRIIFLMPDGRFTSNAIRPGEYRLAAVHANTPGDHTDPELLRRLDATAIRIRVARGEKQVVRVTVP